MCGCMGVGDWKYEFGCLGVVVWVLVSGCGTMYMGEGVWVCMNVGIWVWPNWPWLCIGWVYGCRYGCGCTSYYAVSIEQKYMVFVQG